MSGFWDKKAQSYNDSTVRMFGNANRAIVVKTKKFCSPRSKVLDIGCGTGLIISEVAQIVDKVVAIDPSEKMIAEAKRLNVNKNIEWRIGDFYSAAPQSGEFDIITAYNLLLYLDDPEKLIADIYSALPSGGYFISVTDCIGNLPIFTRMGYNIGAATGLLPKTKLFKPDELSNLVKKCGFEIEEERIVFNRTQNYFIAAKKP
ncbi:MAG: class I SAM-dependent methyltransferase [Oscillospiraceae bacterium]|nr:class I SAM-dependent methyltransferase [Oscillospiraceae bacterium]